MTWLALGPEIAVMFAACPRVDVFALGRMAPQEKFEFDIEKPDEIEAFAVRLLARRAVAPPERRERRKRPSRPTSESRRVAARERLANARRRRCLFCHRPLSGAQYRNKAYCDVLCRNEVRTCRNRFCCKKIRSESGQHKMFCSISCRNYVQRTAGRICPCGRAVPPGGRKFCCEDCRLVERARKARERRRATVTVK